MVQWYSATGEDAQERLIEAWPEAPLHQAELCTMLLEVAQEQVIAFAPTPGTAEASVSAVLERFGLSHKLVDVLAVLELDTLDDPPSRYVYAQLQQATNLWNAGRVSGDGTVGDGAFVFSPRPLDKTVRGIIRPMDGKPHVL